MLQTLYVVSAWGAAACLAAVSLKYVTKRSPLRKLDRLMMKRHRLLGNAALLLGGVHGALMLPRVTALHPLVYVSGVLCLLAVFRAGRPSRRQTGGMRWITRHRLWAATAVVLAALHIVLHVHLYP